jgi:hypothetical protein
MAVSRVEYHTISPRELVSKLPRTLDLQPADRQQADHFLMTLIERD